MECWSGVMGTEGELVRRCQQMRRNADRLVSGFDGLKDFKAPREHVFVIIQGRSFRPWEYGFDSPRRVTSGTRPDEQAAVGSLGSVLA